MATKKKLLQAAAGSAGGAGGLNVEDVFSTYLYEGNGSTQTITNGIDLAGEGGLVWAKSRSTRNHILSDTERGTGKVLFSNSTSAEDVDSTTITSYNSDGFTMGSSSFKMNTSGEDFASWTFRKAPKFFDVVTYTGNGTSGRQISHNLGTKPGFIIVKRTDTGNDPYNYWRTAHIEGSTLTAMDLNTTSDASTTPWFLWSDSSTTTSAYAAAQQTSTYFTVGSHASINGSGGSFVAYLFAHNDGDGDFGPTGDQDIIKCGVVSHTQSNGFDSEVNLGFEPQWLLIKNSNNAGYAWAIFDTMRGWTVQTEDNYLTAESSNAEGTTSTGTGWIDVTPTGFKIQDAMFGTGDYIYIAIRRGPMAVPTDATDVYKTIAYSGTSAARHLDTGFVTDLEIIQSRNSAETWEPSFRTRLTSTGNRTLNSSATAAEYNWGTPVDTELNTYQHGTSREGAYFNASGYNLVSHQFSRAPSFFDVVAYTGNGFGSRDISHNLGVAPEMIWVKCRSTTEGWPVYHSAEGNTKYGFLHQDWAFSSLSTAWANTSPTDSVFTVGSSSLTNGSGRNYVAYLFASLDGVSKVGSYTGTGAGGNQIDCGFSSGARFVLIKRSSGSQNWYVFDTERGIVAGNDPSLNLNDNSAEYSSFDYIDPYSSGFELASGNISTNASGNTYIFYAIA